MSGSGIVTHLECECGHPGTMHPGLGACIGTGATLDPEYGIPPDEECVCAAFVFEPGPHDHLAEVAWHDLPGLGRTPVCGTCGLILEAAGDAIVVPFDTCVCGHPVTTHQTGFGPWTGFCFHDPECECEEPRNPEPFA
jgi:hypothetical protein